MKELKKIEKNAKKLDSSDTNVLVKSLRTLARNLEIRHTEQVIKFIFIMPVWQRELIDEACIKENISTAEFIRQACEEKLIKMGYIENKKNEN